MLQLQPAEVRVPLCVHLMHREPWCKVAPGDEDGSPAVEAGQRCSSLKSQPNSLSAMNSSWRRTTTERIEISAGEEAWQLIFLFSSQNGTACKWAACWAEGQEGASGTGLHPIPFHNFPPNPLHAGSPVSPAEIKCLDILVPPSSHFCAHAREKVKRASLASQRCCGDKHVSDCIYLDITATEAREQTTYSAFRYTALVSKAGNEHGSEGVPFSSFSLLATCSLFL